MKQQDSITTSAPGKLFLLGEYAVLDGAPALVAAVDRRALVRVRAADAWHLRTQPPLPATAPAGGLAGTAVFDAVRAAVAARCDLPPQDVTIDTRTFFGPAGRAPTPTTGEGTFKLGLGASAAVAAALTGALAAAGGLRLTRAELCELAIAAHREAQGGAGSGADVAAAVYGGLIAFTAGGGVQPLDWPEDLHAAAVVTGNGADTRRLVSAVKALADTDPESYRRLIRPLADLAERGRDTLVSGETNAFLEIADAYREALAALGQAAGAGIVLPAHERLAALAADAGAVFKPSGAGGGDLGLLFADSAAALDRACTMVTGAGFELPELKFGAEGLH